jgi:ribosome-associated protein
VINKGYKAQKKMNINDEISIGEDELSFTFSRSSKPGGQNVNKISSRVTLLFDVANSPSLSEQNKHQIMTRLKTRINKEGMLRVVSQRHRHQAANREVAVERFIELLRETLKPVKARKKTRISLPAQKRRLKEKKHRSRLKQERTKPAVWDE